MLKPHQYSPIQVGMWIYMGNHMYHVGLSDVIYLARYPSNYQNDLYVGLF